MKRDNVFSLLMFAITASIIIYIIYFIAVPSMYAGHAWDDYSYAGMAKVKGIFGTVIGIYQGWNGRIFSNFMLALYYRFTEIHLQQNHMWIFFMSCFLGMPFLAIKRKEIDRLTFSLLSISVGLGWLVSMPSICKGISWNTGSFNYLLPLLCGLALLNFYLKITNRWRYLLLIPFYLVLLSGELIPFLFFSLLIMSAFAGDKKKVRKDSLLALIIPLLSLLTILSSPGYQIHQSTYHYENNHNLLFSLEQTLYKMKWFFIDATFSFPIAAGFFTSLFIKRHKFSKKEHFVPVAILLTIFLSIFSVFWNQGYPPPPRINDTLLAWSFPILAYYFWGLFSGILRIRLDSFDKSMLLPIFLLTLICLGTTPTNQFGARLLEVYLCKKDQVLVDYYNYRKKMLTFLNNNRGKHITYERFPIPPEKIPLGLHPSQKGDEHAWIRNSLIRTYQLKSLKWGDTTSATDE